MLGYYRDPETEQQSVRQRQYDPADGKFKSQDPAQSDANLYRYVGNNPGNGTDPSGLEDYDLRAQFTQYPGAGFDQRGSWSLRTLRKNDPEEFSAIMRNPLWSHFHPHHALEWEGYAQQPYLRECGGPGMYYLRRGHPSPWNPPSREEFDRCVMQAAPLIIVGGLALTPVPGDECLAAAVFARGVSTARTAYYASAPTAITGASVVAANPDRFEGVVNAAITLGETGDIVAAGGDIVIGFAPGFSAPASRAIVGRRYSATVQIGEVAGSIRTVNPNYPARGFAKESYKNRLP
jgi:RHS repeat-associated protein